MGFLNQNSMRKVKVLTMNEQVSILEKASLIQHLSSSECVDICTLPLGQLKWTLPSQSNKHKAQCHVLDKAVLIGGFFN